MPSNDERREVAAKLRRLEAENHWEKGHFIVGFIDALGLELRANVGECLLHLADLIEPSERTCEWTWEHSGPLFDGFKCSECLYEFYEPRCVHGYSDLVANYCPNCGAKVVG